MSHGLIVLLEAEEEAFRAAVWYEHQEAGLGHEFVAELDRLLERISANPGAFPAWPGNGRFRKAVLPRFPFVVFFHEREAVIEVVAVAHARRKPGYWRVRGGTR